MSININVLMGLLFSNLIKSNEDVQLKTFIFFNMKFLRNGTCVFDFDKSIITAYCVLVQHNCHYAHFTAVDVTL
ncbi:hypothetical protein T12_15112 [Trichinella patagoniensis]|uniref:Uncharacterized protein n=1 Tax=Trichinella patagoniensis TaxID=990121 RepID=A0A0V1AC23_9BILA|nr:hypothetical protein T12_15112 [Trichinella patagoniensis]